MVALSSAAISRRALPTAVLALVAPPALPLPQVAKYGVPNARQFLQQAFPDGVALSSAYLAPAVIEQVSAAGTSTLRDSPSSAMIDWCFW